MCEKNVYFVKKLDNESISNVISPDVFVVVGTIVATDVVLAISVDCVTAGSAATDCPVMPRFFWLSVVSLWLGRYDVVVLSTKHVPKTIFEYMLTKKCFKW